MSPYSIAVAADAAVCTATTAVAVTTAMTTNRIAVRIGPPGIEWPCPDGGSRPRGGWMGPASRGSVLLSAERVGIAPRLAGRLEATPVHRVERWTPTL